MKTLRSEVSVAAQAERWLPGRVQEGKLGSGQSSSGAPRARREELVKLGGADDRKGETTGAALQSVLGWSRALEEPWGTGSLGGVFSAETSQVHVLEEGQSQVPERPRIARLVRMAFLA